MALIDTIGQVFRRPRKAVDYLVVKLNQNRQASLQKRFQSKIRTNQLRTNIGSGVSGLVNKVKTQEFKVPQIRVPGGLQAGVQRVTQTPLKEYFLPTSTGFKKNLGPALSVLSPLETGVGATIQKGGTFKQRLEQQISEGGNIPGALKSRG